MATKTLRYAINSRRTGTLGTLATLIGIYTAFYLAVIGVIHFMTSPDAMAAIAPDTAVEAVEAATVPNVPPEASEAAREPSTPRLADPAPAATDASRECKPDAGIDTECIFD